MEVYSKNIEISKGQTFGRWEFLDVVRKTDSKGMRRLYGRCRCECGSERLVLLFHLRRGATQSCGCLVREQNTKHGESSTSAHRESIEYRIWSGMIARCERVNEETYRNYGGRGISVCDRWRESFQSFLEDMGRRPSSNHSLDRIDVNGNYEPSNCRWATWKQQQRNKRNNRIITAQGQRKTMAEWAEITGIRTGTISERLRHGWSHERAVTEPLSKRSPAGLRWEYEIVPNV
jgi:hypothetical protein